VTEGEKIDVQRINAVTKEHSETVAKGCVITSVRVGYELEGNIMRMADAVVSLGSEADEKASEVVDDDKDDSEGDQVEETDGETITDGED